MGFILHAPWSFTTALDTANGSRLCSNVVEIIHYRVNGSWPMPFLSLVSMRWVSISNSSQQSSVPSWSLRGWCLLFSEVSFEWMPTLVSSISINARCLTTFRMRSKVVIGAITKVQWYVPETSLIFSDNNILIQCEPVLGRGFRLGKYKCRCRPGYEYPFIDQNDFFTGDAMDAQWNLLMSSNSHMSRFDQLKCRIAVASSLQSMNLLLLLVTFPLSMSPHRWVPSSASPFWRSWFLQIISCFSCSYGHIAQYCQLSFIFITCTFVLWYVW